MKTMGGSDQAKEGKGLDEIPEASKVTQDSGDLAEDPATTECFWNHKAHRGTRVGADDESSFTQLLSRQ